MNDVYIAYIVRERGEKRETVFTFIHPNEARANALAGECMDRAHDATGESFGYMVEPLPYVTPWVGESALFAALHEAVTE